MRIQILDPDTHRLVGIVHTAEDETREYAAWLVPTGYPALVDTATERYCLLPWATGDSAELR